MGVKSKEVSCGRWPLRGILGGEESYPGEDKVQCSRKRNSHVGIPISVNSYLF